MKKEQLKHFEDMLLVEKVQLESELSGLGRKVDGNDWAAVPEAQEGNESDYFDQADLVEEFESKVGRLNAIETRYQEVLRALARIKDGTYGMCLKSGVAIEDDRLQANPAAETCKAMMNSR